MLLREVGFRCEPRVQSITIPLRGDALASALERLITFSLYKEYDLKLTVHLFLQSHQMDAADHRYRYG